MNIPAHRAMGAALLCALCATTIHAQMQMSDVHHSASLVTLAQWQKAVETSLDRNLEWPEGQTDAPHGGMVTVSFDCSDAGKPDKIAITRSSGSKAFDMAAMRAIRRIATLHPLPSGLKPSQRYQANILFGTDSQETAYREGLDRMQKQAVMTNKWYSDPKLTPASMSGEPN